MANLLMNYFYKKGESLRIRPIGRLDLETSGALCFAKNQAAAGRMARQREQGFLYKEYVAVVMGHLAEKSGEIRLPLMKDPENPSRVLPVHGVIPEGIMAKEAITQYEVEAEYEDYSVVRVHILTGRMHQIRCHMAGIGHPLVGDVLYGGADDRMPRTALHARRLSFLQPFTHEQIVVEAELPEDISKLLT